MNKEEKIRAEIKRLKQSNKALVEDCPYYDGLTDALDEILSFIDSLEDEPVSEDLEEAAKFYVDTTIEHFDSEGSPCFYPAFIAGAQWQKEHTCFAGRTEAIEEIKEVLLSEVLPYFMHGGEADEVVAKLDEVLNQK